MSNFKIIRDKFKIYKYIDKRNIFYYLYCSLCFKLKTKKVIKK